MKETITRLYIKRNILMKETIIKNICRLNLRKDPQKRQTKETNEKDLQKRPTKETTKETNKRDHKKDKQKRPTNNKRP